MIRRGELLNDRFTFAVVRSSSLPAYESAVCALNCEEIVRANTPLFEPLSLSFDCCASHPYLATRPSACTLLHFRFFLSSSTNSPGTRALVYGLSPSQSRYDLGMTKHLPRGPRATGKQKPIKDDRVLVFRTDRNTPEISYAEARYQAIAHCTTKLPVLVPATRVKW